MKIITSIFSAFKSAVKKNMYIRSSDQFNIIVAPQKNENQRDIIQMENQLQINLKSFTTGQKKKQFDLFEQGLTSRVKTLYNFAVRGKKTSSDYFGADIWKFFNDDLQDIIVPGAVNHLFIITDGYIYFEDYGKTQHTKNRHSSCKFMSELREPDWEEKFDREDYGIIPTSGSYPNLDVMILEIDPEPEFPDEYSMLTKIWKKWLWEMKIKKVHITKIGPVDKVNEDISEFVGLSLTKVGSLSTPEGIPEPANGAKLEGRFIGTMEGYSRELVIEEVFIDDDGNSNFVYSIKGLGSQEKHRNGKLNGSDYSIEFETIGAGHYEIKNGRYVFMSSRTSEWTFTQI
ncbi:MAG TPA: hypothetical protein VFE50_07230 [Cyclobacteriaceae bacterium]|nr:hypothetical protein [Cyclobacteriaceae bacterium]